MSGYVPANDEGDTDDWRGARMMIKASGADTLEQSITTNGVQVARRP